MRLTIVSIVVLTCCSAELSEGLTVGPIRGPAAMPGRPAMEPQGQSVLHRLNPVELRNVLLDTFGSSVSDAIPNSAVELVQGFDSNAAALSVSPGTVDSMFLMAERVANRVAVAELGACEASHSEYTCASRRLERTARKLLRRPATTEEMTDSMALWSAERALGDSTTATKAVVQRLLASPEFLYHVELAEGASGRLGGYALAQRLSFAAWESGPDDELMDAAARGSLDTREQVQAQLRRLWVHPKGQRTLARFLGLWSEMGKLDGLEKDALVYPGFDEATKESMREEFSRFIADLLTHDGTLKELLSSRATFVDRRMAAFYGVDAPTAAWEKRQLKPERAGGILTQAAFLANHGKAQRSSPILRGLFVRERLLCSPIAPPPPGVAAAENQNTVTTRTTREYYDTLTADATCQGCHALINPIGYTFEGFDGVGQLRHTDNGLPVDTSAILIGTGSVDGPVAQAADMSLRLSASPEVATCMARFFFRSRFRRSEIAGDEAIITALADALMRNDGKLMALANALAESTAFLSAHFQSLEAP